MSEHYLPSLEQVIKASKQLPDPNDCKDETREVLVGKSTSHVILFRRIKYKSHDGHVHRWLFEGKIMFKGEAEKEEEESWGILG